MSMKTFICALVLLSGLVSAQVGGAQETNQPDTDFVLISTVAVNPDQVETFKAALLPYMALTRAEAGCVNYFANQSTTDSTQFVTYEHWSSPQARTDHMNNAYFTQYFNLVTPMFQAHTPPYPIRNQYLDVR